MPPERFSQSLERGLAILGQFSPQTPLLGVREIAEALAMPTTTTHRYVTTLVALGHLRQGTRRKYQLAFGVTRLGMETMNATGLRKQASSSLLELHRRTGLIVSLGILDGPSLVYVERLQGRQRGSRLPPVTLGAQLPAHNTALGKLLLAHLPTRAQHDLVRELTLAKTAPKTITNRMRLARELRETREEDLAHADEELAPGVVAIAAAVRGISHEVVAAVGLAADAAIVDMDRLAEQLGPHLIATADLISARLGYRRTNEPRGTRP